MESKKVYVITCGETDQCTGMPGSGDPLMTTKGNMEVAKLRECLPRQTNEVVCGTGARHSEIPSALNLQPTRFSTILGTADVMENCGGKDCVVLSRGLIVPNEKYLWHSQDSARNFIKNAPDQTVLCCSKEFISAVGMEDIIPQTATVYVFEVKEEYWDEGPWIGSVQIVS